jgi:hypothetical protein
MYDINGEWAVDRDSLVVLLSHTYDAYLDFELTPDVDEISELSSWASCVFEFGSKLEEAYGKKETRRMFESAWQEVRRE